VAVCDNMHAAPATPAGGNAAPAAAAPTSSSSSRSPYAVDAATLSLNFRPPLRPAPVFYPTESEFSDPHAYVRSIRHIGQRAGICKIVPPPNWRPSLQLNFDTFQFRSKVQRLDMLQKRGAGGQANTAAEASGNTPADGAHQSSTSAPMPDTNSRAAADSAAAAAAARAKPSKRKRETSEGGSKSGAGSKVKSHGKRGKSNSSASYDPYSLTRCELCHGADHDDKILLCDECDGGFHLFCLSPPLSSIPDTDWFCPQCLAAKINSFGFDMGRTFTLKQFKKQADEFKRAWFSVENAAATLDTEQKQAADASANGDIPMSEAAATGPTVIVSGASRFIDPSPAEISRSFWRILEESTTPVSVDYGSDLDTELLGSGFPKDNSAVGQAGFNLHNLALSPGGIFNWLDESLLISGVTIPWLYIGMLFSTFCWVRNKEEEDGSNNFPDVF
jgi:histone demethylase JARID1